MMRFVRDLRLIPIALIASACLLAMKTADLALHSSYLAAHDNAASGDGDVSVTRPMPNGTQPLGGALSWAQQMFNFPDGSGGAPPIPSALPSALPPALPHVADNELPDITGSVSTEPASGEANSGPAKPAPGAKNVAPPLGKDGKPMVPLTGNIIPTDGATLPGGAERAILERLQERRQELDTRARELDIRESLIQGAEKRMDARLSELKDVEARIKVETAQKDEAENGRLKSLITMYENMKPRDAAKIFNGLDSAVLLQVASQINPRTMAEIMAQMSADVAQHLTVELASKAQPVKSGGADDLPKIEGQATAN